MICYVIASFLIDLKLLKSSRKVVTFTVSMIVAGLFFEYSGILPHLPDALRGAINFYLISRQSQIVTAFLCGIIAYQLKDIIPYSAKLFIVSVVVCIFAAFMLDEFQTTKVITRVILLPALTYITMFIGLTPIKLPKLLKRGDYSYGVYLYHFPLLQLVVCVFPTLCLVKGTGIFFAFFVGLPFIFLVAGLSWHFVERPILSLRKKFSFVARIRGVEESK